MVELLWPACLAGLMIAVVAGPLGSFIVWRRMAYFGDALAHSALLGAALGVLLHISINLTILLMCLGFAVCLVVLEQKKRLSIDTLLGILAHSALALGLVLISLSGVQSFNLHAFLFGDLLAIDKKTALMIVVYCLILVGILNRMWRPLLNVTVCEEIAFVEGYRVGLMKLILMALMAVAVALGMKIVGVLLITALLIIPAASARQISQTPEQMACFASMIGMTSVMIGLSFSYFADAPTGPSIVLAASLLFLLALLCKRQMS